MMRWWPALLLLPLAGCVGHDVPDTLAAHSAFDVSQASATDRYDYSLFIGITGSEGPMNLTRYTEALTAAGDNAARMAKTFDFEVDDGPMGDGRVGAWYTTHFAYDAESHLVGGLISQVRPDGRLHTLLAPFRGPYEGTVTLATQDRIQAEVAPALSDILQFQAEAQQDEQVLCTLTTRTQDWLVDSEDAAALAMATPTMQSHRERYPDGELTYYYFPGLAVEADCPAELRVEDNYWLVMHTDLDQYLDPSTPDPSLATVRIDAETGAVVREDVTGLVQLRQPFEATIDHQDPSVPPIDWTTIGVPILVQEGASKLVLDASRSARPLYLLDEDTRLVGPDGQIVEGGTLYSSYRFRVADPQPGEWMFEYRYRSATPQGQHVVELHGDVYYG